MPATPMDIRLRPYSVEPFTKVMLPDGIFDTALFSQEITCHYTNESAATLHNVTIYLEGVGDPGIVPVPPTHAYFRRDPRGRFGSRCLAGRFPQRDTWQKNSSRDSGSERPRP